MGPASSQRDERERLEQQLLDGMKASEGAYRAAAAQHTRIRVEFGNMLDHPDTTAAVQDASHLERVALENYTRALKLFTDLVIYGRRPAQGLIKGIPLQKWVQLANASPNGSTTLGVSMILVIDDEPMVVRVVEMSLRQDGYEVVAATNVQQAIETASSFAERITLIIVNHSLSLTPGRNLVEAIERIQPAVKVLRFSGHSEEHLRATGQIKPESFFLQKPFTSSDIRKKVREIIGPPARFV